MTVADASEDRVAPPLEVLPLGGLGEIGMNCMLIGHRDRWILIDCGLQFPDAGELGVERRLPDVRLLERWRDRIEAIVITHGHEDHIGALPWALPALGPLPVFASRFTRELIQLRLQEHGLWEEGLVTLHRPGQRFTAGPFEIEPIRVTHSLPDCCAIVLRCADGTILHTGDWKIDRAPVDGEAFDAAAFERLGDEGVTLMLSDSTNVLAPGWTRGEEEVRAALLRRVEAWPDRVVVAQFASNLHRTRGLAAIAQATGRQLVLAGNSFHKYLAAADRAGIAPFPLHRAIDISKAERSAEAARTLVATTGSQGERLASLTRAARGEHRHLRVGRGDLVLHSARVIPGNEGVVYGMFNDLARLGCELVYGRRTDIHASGHACQDELRELLRLVRPAHMVPIHGEYTFLRRHAALALEAATPGATVVANGDVFGFGAGSTMASIRDAGVHRREPVELLFNDGPATGDRDEMRLGERLKLAWNGVVVVDAHVHRGGDRPVAADVTVELRALWDDGGTLADAIRAAVSKTFANVPDRTPLPEIRAAVVASVRALCRRATGKRPEVIAVLHEGRAH